MKIEKRWITSFAIICFIAIASLFWENKNELHANFLTAEAINYADVAWLLTSSSFEEVEGGVHSGPRPFPLFIVYKWN